MSISRNVLLVLLALNALLLGGCASFQDREPIQVIIADVEPLQGEGLELRMLVKLRVQNPTDVPLAFNGVAVQMDVQDKLFATGVSNAVVSVPRFGEAIIDVPVSISLFRVAHQAIGFMSSEFRGELAYEMTGKLAGPALNSVHFKSNGVFTLPAEIFGRGK